ncbi:MAG: hypothetical protein E6K88_08055 [Thaumarchaeota archaeon]|nr:MAG: hypothetical protein E6K88_08055 [Nitrososphaerota archaeon]
MKDDSVLDGDKKFRQKIEDIYDYDSQGKKHPTLRKNDAIQEFGNACKEAGMAPHDISSNMKFRFSDLIREGKLSAESIDKALGPEFKNHNLARKRRKIVQVSGHLTSGNTASGVGYVTVSGGVIASGHGGITAVDHGGSSGLGRLEVTDVSGVKMLSDTTETVISDSENFTNSSSVDPSGSNENHAAQEPHSTMPIIQVIPGTAILKFGATTTRNGGHVISAEGATFLPAIGDRSNPIRELVSVWCEALQPLCPIVGEKIYEFVNPIGSQSSPPPNRFSAISGLTNSSTSKSGIFFDFLK